jgi:hypothetical protein
MHTSYMNVAVKVGTLTVTQEEVEDIIFGLKLGLPVGRTTSKLIQQFQTMHQLLDGAEIA